MGGRGKGQKVTFRETLAHWILLLNSPSLTKIHVPTPSLCLPPNSLFPKLKNIKTKSFIWLRNPKEFWVSKRTSTSKVIWGSYYFMFPDLAHSPRKQSSRPICSLFWEPESYRLLQVWPFVVEITQRGEVEAKKNFSFYGSWTGCSLRSLPTWRCSNSMKSPSLHFA